MLRVGIMLGGINDTERIQSTLDHHQRALGGAGPASARRELDNQLGSQETPAAPLTNEQLADQEAQRRLLAAGVISDIKPSSAFRRRQTNSRPYSSKGSRCRKPLSASAANVAAFFLDSSAVVKRYVQEAGTAWIRALASSASGHFIYVARISDVEVTSALARRRGQPGLSIAQANAALGLFRQDFAQDYRIAEITVGLLQRAALLADLHAIRGYDAVQLAAALELRLHVPAPDPGFGGCRSERRRCLGGAPGRRPEFASLTDGRTNGHSRWQRPVTAAAGWGLSTKAVQESLSRHVALELLQADAFADRNRLERLRQLGHVGRPAQAGDRCFPSGRRRRGPVHRARRGEQSDEEGTALSSSR